VQRAVAVAAAVVVAGGVVWLALPGGDDGHPAAARTPAVRIEAETSHSASPTASSPSASPTPPPSCATVPRAFDPRSISVPGVTKARVITPPRDAQGVPGVPPLTSAGKAVFAFDREQGVRPGDPAGNVLLNAHTWPDGSALGNHLLASLNRGDRIIVLGAGQRLCYRVTERVEVLASRGLARYYATDGPAQLAIVVCSGRRLGPGEWEKRTVWFAAPSA
jgi:hypothetical protein